MTKKIQGTNIRKLVTRAMVRAAGRILRESGALDHISSAHDLVVRKMLEAALEVGDRKHGRRE